MWIFKREFDGDNVASYIVGYYQPSGELYRAVTLDHQNKAIQLVNYLNGGQSVAYRLDD